MASSNWSIEDEKMFQQLAQRRTSQMPLPTAGSSGAMTDASKRRIEDAEFEVDKESDWVVGSSFMEPVEGTEDLATKALLPAGVTNMAMWGKTKFAFGKYEKEGYAICAWAICAESGWVTAYIYGMEFISKGGVKIV